VLDALRRKLSRASQGEPIVVVSGLPRSGTSMMMKMLEAGGVAIWSDHQRGADIDNPKGYYELERIKNLEKETDKSYLREGRGKAVKAISFLIKDLPDDNDYRVIFMRRDLDEVIASQEKMIARLEQGDTSADPDTLKEAYRNDIVRTRLLCKKRPNFELIEVHGHRRPAAGLPQGQRLPGRPPRRSRHARGDRRVPLPQPEKVDVEPVM
jgi:hypothetical protein